MRALTFAGFLTYYIRTLSAENTTNIDRLTREAATTNARLREPLLLYAFWTDKQASLQRCAKIYGLDTYFGTLLSCSKDEIASAVLDGSLPVAYQKVWNSFLRRKDRYLADNETKALMRLKVIALQKEKNISNYRIYTDLNLNPGNLNAWLKHGNYEKVSLKTARRVLRYMEKE